jgi:hypothetical protein
MKNKKEIVMKKIIKLLSLTLVVSISHGDVSGFWDQVDNVLNRVNTVSRGGAPATSINNSVDVNKKNDVLEANSALSIQLSQVLAQSPSDSLIYAQNRIRRLTTILEKSNTTDDLTPIASLVNEIVNTLRSTTSYALIASVNDLIDAAQSLIPNRNFQKIDINAAPVAAAPVAAAPVAAAPAAPAGRRGRGR